MWKDQGVPERAVTTGWDGALGRNVAGGKSVSCDLVSMILLQ